MEKEDTERQLQLIKMREDALTKLVSLNIRKQHLKYVTLATILLSRGAGGTPTHNF